MTPDPFDSELLPSLFERQASDSPDAVAIVSGRQLLTYGAVEQAANQLAGHLRSLGVGRGCNVAILLPRSTDAYIAILAAMKAGAAYVPLDPDYPTERVAYILADCGAQALVTTATLAAKASSFTGSIVLVDKHRRKIARQSVDRLAASEQAATPTDLAYIIYTSGSTGRPKGVQIEHRSVCHFVRAEASVFDIRPTDRVYQGFSLAFDASIEEIWLAFFAGATLVVGTRDMAQSGPDLARRLNEAGVTVFSCVPTLLAILEEEMPRVRLLILGGEACPQHLVTRWWRPERRMVNTYGPTEATVVATYVDCHPERPITIGRPLPNCFADVFDSEMNPVAIGATGELHLGGIGLARGYHGRPDLTREKFVPNPRLRAEHGPRDQYGSQGDPAPQPTRLYKTGDLARWNADGNLEFMGRADTQVKIRGFRVELSEIESVMLECPGVAAAAVTLQDGAAGVPQLVAYVVESETAPLSDEQLRSILRARLPSYMVPSIVERIAAMPTLSSGKVDRSQLPAPRSQICPLEIPATSSSAGTALVAGASMTLENKLAAAWRLLFGLATVNPTDDFFGDLGGHSLLAARMVSTLRKDADFRELSVLQVYKHPTVASLAEVIRGLQTPAKPSPHTPTEPVAPRPHFQPVSASKHLLCGIAQFLSLYLIVALLSVQWLAPYLTYTWLIDVDKEYAEAILAALAALIGAYPLMLAISIAVKWLVIGRYKAGQYPLWGWYYFRLWFVNAIQRTIPVSYLCGTPLLGFYYRAMGAKIGENVYLGTDGCFVYDLLSIGDDSSIGADTSLAGFRVEGGLLHVGPITIGKRCYVGTRAVVREHCMLEDDSKLEDLSMLPRGGQIPAGQIWSGSPGRQTGVAAALPKLAVLPRPTRRQRTRYGILHAIGLSLFPMLVTSAIFPGMIVMNELNYADEYYSYLVWSPAVALSFVVILCLEIAAVKWLLLGRVVPGRYPLHSPFYLRKWFVDQLMELSLDIIGPLYATIYLNPWYKLLGAKIGRRAEISTASFISPDLLDIGDEGFIADAVSLGGGRVDRGAVTVANVTIGARSFIGNSALLPPGAVIGANCLVGCLSTLPRSGDAANDDTAWLGSPPFYLPQRQKSSDFASDRTFEPTRGLWIQRALIEFVRITLPTSGFISLTSILFSVVLIVREELHVVEMLLWFPVLYALCGLTAAAATVLLKWLLMGRYVPSEKPLWHNFVWRNELITAMCEGFAGPFFVHMLQGTPMICWFFRLMGAKIGRRVVMNTSDLTEFDLVRIGDDSALNTDATVQTHLFEDRVMKMSYCDIGARCTVGEMSLVLYDTRMEDDSALDDLSLLMKSETLPAATAWQGIPATTRAGGV